MAPGGQHHVLDRTRPVDLVPLRRGVCQHDDCEIDLRNELAAYAIFPEPFELVPVPHQYELPGLVVMSARREPARLDDLPHDTIGYSLSYVAPYGAKGLYTFEHVHSLVASRKSSLVNPRLPINII